MPLVESKNNNKTISTPLVACPSCKGSGALDHKKCPDCGGQGMGRWFVDSFLYWGKRIDLRQITQNKIKEIVRRLLNAVLLLVAVLGVSALGWLFLERGWNNSNSFIFWRIADWRILVFYFSLLTDFYFYYRLEQASRIKIKVKSKTYEEDLPQAGPATWQESSQLKNKEKVDVSQAYSHEAIMILEKSYQTARKFNHAQVKPIHLFGALFQSQKIQIIFNRLSADPKKLAEKIARVLKKVPLAKGKIILATELKIILLDAYTEAYASQQKEVGVAEILLAILKQENVVGEILYDLNIDLNKVRNVVIWRRVNEELRRRWQEFKSKARLKPKTVMNRAMTAVATPILETFSQDLTVLAKYGYFTPCVGREKEIETIFRVLESGRKSVILVGNPGIGKSTLLEGIAQRMVEENVPKVIHDKRLVSLNIAKLVSGFSPAAAEGQLMRAVEEIMRAGNIVLAINDIQDMIGITSGRAESLDLSEVLAGPIRNGYIIVLATANNQDYTRYIERSALGDVLKKVEIDEPGFNETIQILEAKAGPLEFRNKIFYSYEAVEATAHLADRYIQDRFLPEKAINILEEVAVYVKKIRGAQAVVTGEDVAKIIAEKTKIPVTKVTEAETEKLLSLETRIHDRMVNQEEAVLLVSKALRRARAELRDLKRPIVNLLFLGPTGVGKTELAKTVAEVYFGSEDQMIRLDMSEYQEKSSINRLLGAPPGYVGADSGFLTEAVRHNPFSLLLLDEIEKAHPDILNIFLQVMEDGRLTDTAGRTINFTNIILIGTSNAGTSFIQEEVQAGTELNKIKKELINQQLKSYFRPEFLNRFDGLVVFKPLSQENVHDIAKLMLVKVARRLEKQGIGLQVSDRAVKELAQAGFDPKFGARPLRRVIQEKVDDSLANLLLQGQLARRDTVLINSIDDIQVQKAEEI